MEDEMKKQIELFTNSNSLPKIDLRVSLPGSIRKTTLLELASSVEKKDIESCFSKITREAPYLFNEVNSKLFKSIDIVKRVTKEILEDWKKHNVIYMEIVTNLYSLEGKFNKEEFLLAVLEQINEENKLSEKFNGRLIISLNKKDNIKDYEEIYNIYNDLKNEELKKIIVGIDYSGNINSSKIEEHKLVDIIPILEKFKKCGLKVTMELGECPDYEFIPLNSFVPDRLSHGYFLKNEHIEEIMKNNINIEICPSYDFKINKCIDYSEIYMKKFWNKKVKDQNGIEVNFNNISINSDCRTLMLTDISQEYYEIGLSFNLDIKGLKILIQNSINSMFDKNEELKAKLLKIIENFNI